MPLNTVPTGSLAFQENSMKKSAYLKAAIAAVTGFGVFMEIGWSFSNMMIHYKNKDNKDKKQWFTLSHIKINHPRNGFEEIYNEGKEWCYAQQMQDISIRSFDGLILHAKYFPADEPERTVLLSHGYKGTSFSEFANIARFLHENGCNLLFIDQRCCGESEGEFITFGAKEKRDIQQWAFYLSSHDDMKLPIYLYGESMGAASVLMASGLKLPRSVKGIISDCAFQSMKWQIKDMAANWFHLDHIDLLLMRVDWYCKIRAGFKMSEADTWYALRHNKLPVLFFHGDKDTYVHVSNSWRNYRRCRAEKELVIVPGARHLCSCYVAPELYRNKLMEFFEKND